MYIELFGPEKQPESVWDEVRLRVRHLSRAYFLAGDTQIKQYQQRISETSNLIVFKSVMERSAESIKRNLANAVSNQ